MSDSYRHVVLRARPSGLVAPSDVEVTESEVPTISSGEALVRTDLVAVDAAVRTWLNDQPGYLPPVALGETVRAGT